MAPTRIEIPPFPHNKRIAVTTSFDDGHTFDRKLIAAFNQWGLKGTFNLNSGKLQRTGKPAAESGDRTYLDASEIQQLYAGHEVAIHTVTHPWLTRLDSCQVATEVLDDRKALEDLVQYPVRGMAYPFGAYNSQIISTLRALGVVYARTCGNAEKCFPPEEPLEWATTAHQFASAPGIAERFEALYNNPRHTGVFFIWGHAYEFHDRKDWDALERIFKPLSGRPDVWYCTNIELFDYEDARRRLVVAANRCTAYNPSGMPVTIAVDGSLLEIPPGQTALLASQ